MNKIYWVELSWIEIVHKKYFPCINLLNFSPLCTPNNLWTWWSKWELCIVTRSYQAASHNLIQWWPRPVTPHAIIVWGTVMKTLWCHLMETFSALLLLFTGNPPVTGGFPSQRNSNADLWCFFVCLKSVKQTLDWQVIRDGMTVIWRRCNVLWEGKLSSYFYVFFILANPKMYWYVGILDPVGPLP